MNQIGMYLKELIIIMITKYNFSIEKEVLIKTLNRLTNQVWKLIPMVENNEDWKKQLNTVILEITGLNEIFSSNPYFLSGLAKLEGLRLTDYEFDFIRKTVFEVISILQDFKNNEFK